MSTSHDPAAALRALVGESPFKIMDAAKFLDGLSHNERVRAVRGLGRAEQRKLYAAADGFAPVGLGDLVPPTRRDLEPVRHWGRNTLPAFTLFEKRFCRPAGEDPHEPRELYGYNHSPYRVLPVVTGPGYFVAVDDAERGEVLIDYRRVPPARPEGWPPIRGNDRGAARLVFGGMVDTLRRASEHVTIGSAARGGKDLGSWFVLCREP